MTTVRRTMPHIARLAWPILVGQLAVVGNGVIDTAMCSRASAQDLASLSLGISIYISIFVALSGVVQALTPIIGQLFGANAFENIGEEVKQGAWLGIFLSIIGCTALLHPDPLLALAQPKPELLQQARNYLFILVFALPAALGFRIFAALNYGLGRPRMVTLIQVIGLALKIPLNYALIFGQYGLPAMGATGCALATTLIAWLMLIVAVLWMRNDKRYRPFALSNTGWRKPDWQKLSAQLKLGVPMGLSYLIEVTAFTFMALFIARLGPIAVGGHQLVSSLGTIMYMLPLSIANATCSLVAQAIGAKEMTTAKIRARAGLSLSVACTVPLGLLVWLVRAPILHLYTNNESLVAAALPLMLYVCAYQLFDALQSCAAYVLRAYQVTIIPTVLYAVSLWGVGLAGGYILGLDPFHIAPKTLHGASGFWFGNSAALAMIAAGLLLYLRKTQQNFAAGKQ